MGVPVHTITHIPTRCHHYSDLVTFGKKTMYDLNDSHELLVNILGITLSRSPQREESMAYMCSQLKLMCMCERQKSDGMVAIEMELCSA